MKKIPLTQGRFTIVDDDVYEWASKLKWCWRKGTGAGHGYAGKTFSADHGLSGMMFLHHCVIGYPLNGLKVDHIDGDGLNNQRNNLRIATVRQNGQNLKIHRAGRLPGCYQLTVREQFKKGLWEKTYWKAAIRVGDRQVSIGHFNTEQEAHEAYLNYIKKHKLT
jgi:hypothetical protein